ncbi:MAG: DUF2490 domain-containing protein [Ferruginibacter sp.]
MIKHFLLFIFFSVCVTGSFAQKQFSGWLASFNTFKIGKKTSIHSDVQLRSSDEWQRMQTLLLRAGLNYHVSKKSTITAGYAFVENYRVSGGVNGYLPEHRIWEQFIYAHKISPVFLSHRFRVEQRFLPKAVVSGNALKKEGSLYANRFRYFVRGILPFSTETKGISNSSFTKGMFAALQNEVFLNFGNKANVNGKTFDQNRLYVAVGYRFSKKFDLEAGYMNQYIDGRNDAFTNNHIAQLATYIRL